ncbi:N-acetylmuramoyl-L-alanine amidase family protein [Candidatus Palauibacter sp.]|uniref:N-acetylmuramoyl-L-alanine amidase family protein n=1 Tax=Candidatus Palauibacter sp. TaxID=3101350 RepID=UPI003CC59838
MKLTVLTAAVVLFAAGFVGPGVGMAAAQEQRATERDASDDASDRWRRWRNYNRYPGPIPTPEEWGAPAGPIRIGLQAGHWRAAEAPRELRRLRYNGTQWQKTAEWEANLAIAELAGAQLEALGYEVDILPAVVPPGYRAHLFIAIHADGSDSPAASGYRVASPRRDATGRAEDAARLLRDTYGAATGLRNLPVQTRRMQNYYAFNYRRYEHALHPMTIALIIETGFITSAHDRRVILDAPQRAARGIVEAVKAFPITALPGR